MDVLLRTWRALPWNRLATLLFSRPAELLLAGVLSGVIAASGIAQHQAQWGSSGPMERGLAAAVIIGLIGGCLLHRQVRVGWPMWLMISASLSLILPWWLDQVVRLVALLPANFVLPGYRLESIGWFAAVLSSGIPLAFQSALVCAVCGENNRSHDCDGDFPLATWFGSGAGLGLVVNSLALGPWLGAEVTTIVAAGLALVVSYRGWNRRTSLSKNSQCCTTVETEVASSLSASDRLLSLLALFGCGGGLALSRDLWSQLAPHTAYLQQGTWAAILTGLTIGSTIAGRMPGLRRRLPWAMLLIAAGLSLAGIGFEPAVRISLWSAAYVTDPTLHQLALCGLTAAALLPMAFAAGLLIELPRTGILIAGLASLLIGMTFFRELAMVAAPGLPMIAAICGVSVLALITLVVHRAWPQANWQAGGVSAAILACGFVVPFLPAPDAASPAKLLFSTPTFLAYRAGWNVRLLGQLDDARLVAVVSGRQGPQTVWKSRGADLLLREAGVPRCTIACRPDISPQVPSEVLQTVFSLTIAGNPRRVLLLGGSGGVPLSTCLSFPVQEVTCVEPDHNRVELIRGPIAAERGFDPFNDERVWLDRRPVELAAMMSDGGYDVILSSPPPSSVASATPQFTQEFYQRVSRKLSVDGVFCQRFETIDYGPLPFQLISQSLLSAFHDVVAVEIGIGEFLFLATNSEHGLAPSDMPQRLEKIHVRRVLARCGLDWSTLLTLGAWDREALEEIAAEGTSRPNTAANCRLELVAPREMLRWSPKLHDMQQLLTKPRGNVATAVAERGASGPWFDELSSKRGQGADAPRSDAASTSRRARFLDWLGESVASKELLRRLSEVAAQSKIVQEGPDSFWLDYRKALREELQQRPRTEIRQVGATDETTRVLHPEDERRKEYFAALGAAGDLEHKSLEAVRDLANYLEPYDPLVSLFARQEIAELLALYGHPDPAEELALRLHVIYFAPAGDRSLRNILAAAELLLKYPQAAPDPQDRFDTLNGLLQTLRSRWEVRSASQLKSVRLTIQDIDRSIVLVQSMVDAMDELAPITTITAEEWQIRKEVIDRVLLRPLRGYRVDLFPRYAENKAKTEALLEESRRKKD